MGYLWTLHLLHSCSQEDFVSCLQPVLLISPAQPELRSCPHREKLQLKISSNQKETTAHQSAQPPVPPSSCSSPLGLGKMWSFLRQLWSKQACVAHWEKDQEVGVMLHHEEMFYISCNSHPSPQDCLHFVRGCSARACPSLFGPEISIPGTPDYIPRPKEHQLVPSIRSI